MNTKIKLAMIFSDLNRHKRDRDELLKSKIDSRLLKNLSVYEHELDVLMNSMTDTDKMRLLSGHARL